ncbi:MAG: DinB family protein, partial [Chloroflexi bacterium]|nr:DinB family protein [Chloroflexota bacterium]
MDNNKELRNQLARMLTFRQAHMDFEDAVANFPAEHINTRPPNCDYTFWHLLEHIRICQRDILEYIEDDAYQWPNFPDDLWPDKTAVTDFSGWQQTIQAFLADRQALVKIINNPDTDLFAPLPNSDKYQHNILREINIIANHNAYHTGELGALRQIMNL